MLKSIRQLFKKETIDNMYFNEDKRTIQIRDSKYGNWYMIDKDFVIRDIVSFGEMDEILPMGTSLMYYPSRDQFYFPSELTTKGYLEKMKLPDQKRWPASVQTWK